MTKTLNSYFKKTKLNDNDSVDQKNASSVPVETVDSAPKDLVLQGTWPNKKFKLYDLWNYLGQVNDVFFIILTQDGINFRNKGPNGHRLVDVHLNKDDLSGYIYNLDERFTAPIKSSELLKKFNRFKGQVDRITFSMNDKSFKDRRFDMECRGIHFSQLLLSDDEYDEEVPSLDKFCKLIDSCARFVMELPEIVDVLEFASDLVDQVNLKVNKREKSLTIQGDVEDGSTFYKNLKLDGEPLVSHRVVAVYDVYYLLEGLKITTAKTSLKRFKVALELSTGLIMRLTVNLTSKSSINYFIAPIIRDESGEDVLWKLGKLFLTPTFFSLIDSRGKLE